MIAQDPHKVDVTWPRNKGLWLISLYKIVKGTLFIAAAAGMLSLLHKEVAVEVERWLRFLRVDPDNHFINKMLTALELVTDQKLRWISAGTFLYACLTLTEGIGLSLGRRWAEYLTVVATTLFIPIEVFEIFHHFTWIKIAVFCANVAMVIYLAYRIKAQNALEQSLRLQEQKKGSIQPPSPAPENR